MRTATGGLKVADVMVHDPTTLEVSFPLSVVAPFLQATPGRVLPVVDHGRYVGLIAADHLGGRAGAVLVEDATDRLAPALSAPTTRFTRSPVRGPARRPPPCGGGAR